MMNSSRPVTDPKLAVFELLIARTLRQTTILKRLTLSCGVSKTSGTHQTREKALYLCTTERRARACNFFSLYLFTLSRPWSALAFCCQSRTCENPSMSAFRGRSENICSLRAFRILTHFGHDAVARRGGQIGNDGHALTLAARLCAAHQSSVCRPWRS
jgi:hypothetical protein